MQGGKIYSHLWRIKRFKIFVHVQSKCDVMFVPIDTSVIFGDFRISKLQINKCFVTYEISK